MRSSALNFIAIAIGRGSTSNPSQAPDPNIYQTSDALGKQPRLPRCAAQNGFAQLYRTFTQPPIATAKATAVDSRGPSEAGSAEAYLRSASCTIASTT